jgi:ribonuclease HIII
VLALSSITIKKTIAEIEKMKSFYEAALLQKNPPHSVFSAKTAACTITAYKSGKVLFQGSGCEAEAGKWGGGSSDKSSSAKKSVTISGNLPANISSLSIIGSDEVGTGDYFGPITVVAAYVKKEQLALLTELGVQDSKNLNDEKICKIAKDLIHVVPHSLLTLKNEKYNQLQQSGMSQGKMKAWLHNQAIEHVSNKIAPEKPEAILIDQFAKEEVYYNYLRGKTNIQRDKVLFSTKAEGIHLAVAAASIIARYAFVRNFENLSKEAGFTIPKGAGPKVDLAAAQLIKDKGREVLPHFVKLHFANTEKALKLLK